MITNPHVTNSAFIEAQIAERIKAAQLRLQFDKVALRLARTLKDGLAGVVADGRSVAITVSAPIKHPAKTADQLEQLVRNATIDNDDPRLVWGNEVRLREVVHDAANIPKILVFIHTPECDAESILHIATSCILELR